MIIENINKVALGNPIIYVKEKTIIIPFGEYTGDFPCSIIPINILNKDGFILLDTGANISGLNIDFFNDAAYEGLVPKREEAVGGFGEIIDSFEVFDIDFNIESINFTHEFKVGNFNVGFDQLKDLFGIEIIGILGADFIEKYGLHIDLQQKIVWFKIMEDVS